jgi:hypothetical protein
MEDVGIFYGHLVHFTVPCYILWTFGTVRGNLVYFFPFWYFVQSKINPDRKIILNFVKNGQFTEYVGVPSPLRSGYLDDILLHTYTKNK